MTDQSNRNVARFALHVLSWPAIIGGLVLLIVGVGGAQYDHHNIGGAWALVAAMGMGAIASELWGLWVLVGCYLGYIKLDKLED